MIIIKPIISEKSMQYVTAGKYMFQVALHTSKNAVKEAIEKMYGVKVESVNTQVRPGKTKHVLRKRQTTHTSPRRFAIVTLTKGQKIAGFDKALQIEEENNEKV